MMSKTIALASKMTASLRALALAGLTATALLGGCAALQPDPHNEVRRLATQRWQALLAGNIADAYDHVVPSFKAVRSLEKYKQNIESLPVKWVQAEVTRVNCEQERCKVQVRLLTQLRIPARFKGNLESYTEETWIREKGQWWVMEDF